MKQEYRVRKQERNEDPRKYYVLQMSLVEFKDCIMQSKGNMPVFYAAAWKQERGSAGPPAGQLEKVQMDPRAPEGRLKNIHGWNTMTGLTADESEDEREEMSGDVNASHVGEDKLEE